MSEKCMIETPKEDKKWLRIRTKLTVDSRMPFNQSSKNLN